MRADSGFYVKSTQNKNIFLFSFLNSAYFDNFIIDACDLMFNRCKIILLLFSEVWLWYAFAIILHVMLLELRMVFL